MDKKIYQDHLRSRLEIIQSLLVDNGLESLILYSGHPENYFLDDQHPVFKPNPHFLYLCPVMGEGHVLHISTKTSRPNLLYYQPNDFWHEVEVLGNQFWQDSFDIEIMNNPVEDLGSLGINKQKATLISPSSEKEKQWGIPQASMSFINQLHWIRSQKTKYEIESMSEANEIAAGGHLAAKDCFLNGGSELEILQAYLKGSKQREVELPYGAIVALGANAAILHYQNPKANVTGESFLIDAGARTRGYCSDITRTYCNKKAHPVFKELIAGVEENQAKQVELVQPGTDYVKIHDFACHSLTDLLVDKKIITCSKEEAFDKDLFFAFFPHGLGHPIGIQVHDVAGKQKSPSGDVFEQPKKYPYLRTLRTIQENDALTIEPGLYFIPALLGELKADSNKKKLINWKLVDELLPMGGIRIEDDVIATNDGPLNLTRKYLN